MISAINRAYLFLCDVDKHKCKNKKPNITVLNVIDTLPVNAGINQTIKGIKDKNSSLTL